MQQRPQRVPRVITLLEVLLHAKRAQQVRHAPTTPLLETSELLLVLWEPTRPEGRLLVRLAQLVTHAR